MLPPKKREPSSCATRSHTSLVALRVKYQEHTVLTRDPWVQPKATSVPVDIPPPAHVAGPIPHLRKFSFLIGAAAAMIALLLVSQVVGMMS